MTGRIDVYKRQDYRSLVKVWPVHVVLTWGLVLPTLVIRNAVSYTHLDVYKRQQSTVPSPVWAAASASKVDTGEGTVLCALDARRDVYKRQALGMI